MPDPCRRQAHGPAARYLDALSFLSRLVCSAMTPRLVRQQRAWLCGMLLLAWLAGTPLWQCLLLLAGHFPLQGRLRRTALAHGGLSGDFLGADIELTQLWFLLALL